ncbi:MAG: 4'-phosphopantetheinyl transferase family protein [Geminicoccaceae bacterium]
MTARTDIHVVHWKLDCDSRMIHVLLQDLAPDERQRADRFRFEKHRRSYIAARGMLRRVLANRLGMSPAAIRFAYGQHGKPRLDYDAHGPCQFNLSHTSNVAAVAMSNDLVLGIDVEDETFSDLSIADTILAGDELKRFRALPKDARAPSLMRAWTRKETVLKALGTGFSVEPVQLEISFEPSVPSRLLALHLSAPEPHRWSVQDLSLSDCRYAAIAIIDRPANIDIVVEQTKFQAVE